MWRWHDLFVLLYRQWFVDRCLSFCSFSFCHGNVCPVNNDFWLPIWYIHTFLVPLHNNIIHIYYRWFVLWMLINHVNVTLCYECGSIMSTSHCSMNVDQSCQRHIVLWMWIKHDWSTFIEQINDSIYVLYYYIKVQEKCEYTKWVIRSRYSQDRQYRGKMRKNRTTNNDLQTTDDIVDQSCQRHIILWMWINHVNVTLFYECGSIISTSHCSMNVDQSCQRHIVLWMWINHVNVTSKVKFVMWDAMKRPFQARYHDLLYARRSCGPLDNVNN
jgi:hypothetical protein